MTVTKFNPDPSCFTNLGGCAPPTWWEKLMPVWVMMRVWRARNHRMYQQTVQGEPTTPGAVEIYDWAAPESVEHSRHDLH